MNDYHAYKSTSGGSGGGSGIGCGGWGVIVIVVLLFFGLLAKGADWDSFDSLLGVGGLAFLIANWLMK